jgi:chromosomal replication initiation ATPase DnaA
MIEAAQHNEIALPAWMVPQRVERMPMTEVLQRTADLAGVSYGELVGDLRFHHIAHPRQALMLALSEQRGWSSKRIARELRRKDHTTVLHGIKRARERRARDLEFAALCSAVADLVC